MARSELNWHLYNRESFITDAAASNRALVLTRLEFLSVGEIYTVIYPLHYTLSVNDDYY
jgi:hypothetical protein